MPTMSGKQSTLWCQVGFGWKGMELQETFSPTWPLFRDTGERASVYHLTLSDETQFPRSSPFLHPNSHTIVYK